MEIHKLKCDVCDKEKDLLERIYGGVEPWHEWLEKVKGSVILEKKHFCSIECTMDYLNKKKG